VLLDNFEPKDIPNAVLKARGKALLEVSGGVTIDRIPELARAGVDIASVGALTHSARAADISLEIEPIR
jgi:nicotinate-nucleotide pyrophosphorylase (carboxylating)